MNLHIDPCRTWIALNNSSFKMGWFKGKRLFQQWKWFRYKNGQVLGLFVKPICIGDEVVVFDLDTGKTLPEKMQAGVLSPPISGWSKGFVWRWFESTVFLCSMSILYLMQPSYFFRYQILWCTGCWSLGRPIIEVNGRLPVRKVLNYQRGIKYGWCIMEKMPSINGWFGGSPILGNLQISHSHPFTFFILQDRRAFEATRI